MKRATIILAIAATMSFSALAQTNAPIQRIGLKESKELKLSAQKADSPIHLANDNTGDLRAAFTVLGSGSTEIAWSYDFDNGSEGWTFENDENFAWQLQQQTGKHSFTAIDPDDKQSLYIEGPYQIWKRGTASAISPEIAVPRNATFSGYVGYTLNYDQCTLILFVSSDNENWTELWASDQDTGEKPWAWRKMEIDMSAYSGQTVRFKFTYGARSDNDNKGYLGDFAIDGLKMEGAADTEKTEVTTGDIIKFADASEGNPSSWKWSFPGGTPAESTEQYPQVYYTRDGEYDVTLTVGNGESEASVTKAGFVKVTGIAPTAKILPPATFRYANTRYPMTAPLAPVKFSDASKGFPTSHSWTFTGVDPNAGTETVVEDANPEVSFNYLHEQSASLAVANKHGESADATNLSVEYEGFVTNLQPNDQINTYFDLDGYGEFPGTNSFGITEYAERFSKPSRPIYISGVKVYFTNNMAEHVADQIANVKVALCKSENGLPDEQLEFMSWSVFELDVAQGSELVGTDFEFSKSVAIDDEFFIVVSGIPEKSDVQGEANKVSFALAKFRDQGNTAYFKKDGKWIDASSYFPAGQNHTSYAVFPYMVHSVMSPLSGAKASVGSSAGTTSFEIFSYLGYKSPIASDSEWCRVTSEPNGMTVDNIEVAYDALPEDTESRTATLTLTDGLSTLDLQIEQTKQGGVVFSEANAAAIVPSVFSDSFSVRLPDDAVSVEIYNSTGSLLNRLNAVGERELRIDGTTLTKGMYLVKVTTSGGETTLKAIKR